MNKIKDFDSIVGASKELNIGKQTIRGVLNGYRKLREDLFSNI